MSPRNAQANAEMRRAARAKLLAGSLEVFSERGFSYASMAEIARRSGVSKGLAYHYFDTKEALLQAALGAHLDALLKLTERSAQQADPTDRLAELFDGLVEYVRAQPQAFRLYLSLILLAPTGALAHSLGRLRKPLESYLAQVQRLFVDLGADDPETEAALFRSTLLGLCLRIAMGNEQLPTEALRSRLLQAFTGRPPEMGPSR